MGEKELNILINKLNNNELKDVFVAFPYSYLQDDEKRIEVSNVTCVDFKSNKLLVHFSLGWKSCSEYIKFDDIVGVGDHNNGTHKIEGWSGKFIILNHEHELVKNTCHKL